MTVGIDDTWSCRYCGEVFVDMVNGPNASIQMNDHIDHFHHPVCEGCGCDDCSCEPELSMEEMITRYGAIIYEDEDIIEFARGVAITKRTVQIIRGN